MLIPVLKCCNVAAYAIDIFLNARYGRNIGSLSNAYDHVGTPAGPAFSIWGVIFLWELVFLAAQAFSGMFDKLLPSLTPWFCLAQLMQGMWVPLFTASDPANVGNGGDLAFWTSTILLVCTAPVFLKAVSILSSIEDNQPFWISYGITINAAWVLMAAGLTLNMAGIALGLSFMPFVAMFVLFLVVILQLWIAGFIGNDPFNSPTAYLPVFAWALFWVCVNLGDARHLARISANFGSGFITLYRCCAALLFVFALVCQAVVIMWRRRRQAFYRKIDAGDSLQPRKSDS